MYWFVGKSYIANWVIFFSLLFAKRVSGQPKCHVPGKLPTSWERSRTGAGGKPSTWLPPGGLVEHMCLGAGLRRKQRRGEKKTREGRKCCGWLSCLIVAGCGLGARGCGCGWWLCGCGCAAVSAADCVLSEVSWLIWSALWFKLGCVRDCGWAVTVAGLSWLWLWLGCGWLLYGQLCGSGRAAIAMYDEENNDDKYVSITWYVFNVVILSDLNCKILISFELIYLSRKNTEATNASVIRLLSFKIIR